jgi:hypothetical protein
LDPEFGGRKPQQIPLDEAMTPDTDPVDEGAVARLVVDDLDRGGVVHLDRGVKRRDGGMLDPQFIGPGPSDRDGTSTLRNPEGVPGEGSGLEGS